MTIYNQAYHTRRKLSEAGIDRAVAQLLGLFAARASVEARALAHSNIVDEIARALPHGDGPAGLPKTPKDGDALQPVWGARDELMDPAFDGEGAASVRRGGLVVH